ncbi:hypothetical protein Tco_0493574 [Tanacetum coccineum]
MFLKIIESKSKVRNSRSKPVVAKVSASTSTSGISPDVSELKDMVKALLLDKQNQSQAPAHLNVPLSLNAIEELTLSKTAAANFKSRNNTSARLQWLQPNSTPGSRELSQWYTITNTKEDLKVSPPEVVLHIRTADSFYSIFSSESVESWIPRFKDTIFPTNTEFASRRRPKHSVIQVPNLKIQLPEQVVDPVKASRDRSITETDRIGIAKDCPFNGRKFQFTADFGWSLILSQTPEYLYPRESYLKTSRAIIRCLRWCISLHVAKSHHLQSGPNFEIPRANY